MKLLLEDRFPAIWPPSKDSRQTLKLLVVSDQNLLEGGAL
jgi:hypothetical protein